MAANLLIGALLYGGGFALLGLIRGGGEAVAGFAAAGAVLGLFMGLYWHRRDRRTRRYRSQFDPPGPALTLGSLAPQGGPAPAVSRYRTDPASTIALPLLLPLSMAIAIWMSLNEDPFWVELLFWSIILVIPLAIGVLVVLATYTEIGPHGIRLRTPFRSRTVTWAELAEVGWLRNTGGDVVTLSTHDGRQVRTVGIAVSPTGEGRDRALRMLADIEAHWAASAGVATAIGPS